MLLFNQSFGYLEGLVRGFKNGLLTQSEYQALTQCDTLEDLKIHLSVSTTNNAQSNFVQLRKIRYFLVSMTCIENGYSDSA